MTETMLQHIPEHQRTAKLTWTKIHVPLSVSVCSNVPGYEEPRYFINTNLDLMLDCIINYVEEIAGKVPQK